tara:strand:- start:6042 stop:7340 length:1299 start_codon:yes stop_codon:yes gene_type:complete
MDVVYTRDDIAAGVTEQIEAKRDLGEGRWDKILKQKMVELSVADNYEDAKEEWKATGRVWWSRYNNRDAPDWVTNSSNGCNQCLCGHNIVYHFEIENTENGNIECVGSDHITSYLILREISESTGVDMDAITEKMIQEWINVRVKAMIQESWWEDNGEEFKDMFNEVKEADLRINVRYHPSKQYWDRELRRYQPVRYLRKKSEGEGPAHRRKMASIVWRWNHPENPRNQQTTRGYPNDRLWKDMNRFSTMIDEHLETIKDLDVSIQERIDWLEKFDEEFDTKMVESGFGETLFTEKCKQFGIPLFKAGDGRTASERRFLSMMARKIRTSGDEPNLDAGEIAKLSKVLARVEIPLATQDQKIRIRDLRNMLVEARRENAYVPYFPYRIRRNMNQEEAEEQIRQLTRTLDEVRAQEELRIEIEAESRQHTDGGE